MWKILGGGGEKKGGRGLKKDVCAGKMFVGKP